ncbi:MAG: histone deacetylase [Kiritimatiellae bacterium]|nr:histone deacetylase [Kiritimatiellia bacterium]
MRTKSTSGSSILPSHFSDTLNRRIFLKLAGGALCLTALPSCLTAKPTPQKPLSAVLLSSEYKKHLTGLGHPESPARVESINKAMAKEIADTNLLKLTPHPATEKDILYCHTKKYFDTVKKDVESGSLSLSTGDTRISKDSFDIAMLAAGGAMSAVDAVISGKTKTVFCALRPPGHHASKARGTGFCIFNNAAIAARYAQKKHNIGKVMIVDWDVHHGNGTQDIFYEDGSVFFFSTHQSPFYPGTGRKEETGRGKGKDTTLNCPFPAGSGRKEILGAFEDLLVPAAEKFQPELLIISAGFDSRISDPLGGFRLTDKDFADLTIVLKNIAGRFAQGRIVSLLEGGYNLTGIAKASTAHIRALAAKGSTA